MFFYFCQSCDPEAFHAISGHKKCPDCRQLLYYKCPKSNLSGLYTNYYRHAQHCAYCPLSDRVGQMTKKASLAQATVKLSRGQELQEPYASWKGLDGKILEETGASPQTFDILLRTSKQSLAALHGSRRYEGGKALLTPVNMLLLLLVFLRRNPTERQLAGVFLPPHGCVMRLIGHIAAVVAPEAEKFVKPPSKVRRTISSGRLAGVALVTDTTDIPIPRPGDRQERKLYYNGKTRQWALKFQASIGLAFLFRFNIILIYRS